MKELRKPTEILDNLIQASIFIDRYRRIGPGQVVLRQPESARRVLQELRSDDLANLRPDSVTWMIPRR